MSSTTTDSAASEAPGKRILKPALHHYGVHTPNIDAMTDWYAKVVGFYVAGSSTSPIPSAYVTNDGAHHRGGFFTPPVLHEDLPRPMKGVNHVAFEYESLDDLLESWERLKGIGIEPIVTTCHGTHYAFYYKDPDQNTVELLADAFGDWEKSLAYVALDEYAADPMGPPVDPAKLLEARKQGASIEEVRLRTMARDEFLPVGMAGPEALM